MQNTTSYAKPENNISSKMETLIKYKRIHSDSQYESYIEIMESLDAENQLFFNQNTEDEIELLQLLIQDYEEQQSPKQHLLGSDLLQHLMIENHVKASTICAELDINKSTLSEILSKKRTISKQIGLKLANHFKIRLDKLLTQ